jgi:hypothetical protein
MATNLHTAAASHEEAHSSVANDGLKKQHLQTLSVVKKPILSMSRN